MLTTHQYKPHEVHRIRNQAIDASGARIFKKQEMLQERLATGRIHSQRARQEMRMLNRRMCEVLKVAEAGGRGSWGRLHPMKTV
jgi:hypothetical protein